MYVRSPVRGTPPAVTPNQNLRRDVAQLEDCCQYEVTACGATWPALWVYITGLTGRFRTRSDPASKSEPAPTASTRRGQVTAQGARWPALSECMTGLRWKFRTCSELVNRSEPALAARVRKTMRP